MNKDSIIIGKKEFRKINDNYYISSKGEVYSKFSKRILKCQIQNKNNKPYMSIKNGTKTIELRLNDEKRQLLKIKDITEGKYMNFILASILILRLNHYLHRGAN